MLKFIDENLSNKKLNHELIVNKYQKKVNQIASDMDNNTLPG